MRVIARAVIKLVAAPARVRAYSLLYPDGDTVILRGTKYYSPPATPEDATMLAGLNFVPGVMQIDDLTYVENFSITTGPFPPLRHPAICVVLPASAATQYIQGVLPRLTDADLGSYNVAQIFTWRASRFRQPLARCTRSVP